MEPKISMNNKEVFEEVLFNAVNSMSADVKTMGDDHFKIYSGVKMESLLVEYLIEAAKGTCFEDSIRESTEFAFPDIIAGRSFGIEVKTTDKDHWTSTGNSILESSRIPGVDTIYMFFAKLKPPVKFKYRLYEDCLSDVVVTHYPRYQINMELSKGQTIFEKIGVPYETLKKEKNPAKTILQYYKKQAKDKGNQLWWMNIDDIDDEAAAGPPVLEYLSEVDSNIKEDLICKAYAYFPEIIGGDSKTKYKRWVSWLLIEKSIIVPNVRDHFTAGGVESLTVNGHRYEKVPKVLCNLNQRLRSIINIVTSMTTSDTKKFWGNVPSSSNDNVNTWKEIIINNATGLYSKSEMLLGDMILSNHEKP